MLLTAQILDESVDATCQVFETLGVIGKLILSHQLALDAAAQPVFGLEQAAAGVVQELDLVAEMIAPIALGNVGANGVGRSHKLATDCLAFETLPCLQPP